MDRIKAIIFDLDDTLYDRKAVQIRFARYLHSAFPEIFGHFQQQDVIAAFVQTNLDFVRREEESGINGTSDDHSRYFLNLLGVSDRYVSIVSESYPKQTHIDHTPVPGAIDVITTLFARYPLALLTNGPAASQHNRLRGMGIFDYFTNIVTAPETGMIKPNPEIFRHTAKLLGIPPEECLNIGDSFVLDVIGPKNAGMQACWFNPDNQPVPSGSLLPDFVIRSLSEIIAIIESDFCQ